MVRLSRGLPRLPGISRNLLGPSKPIGALRRRLLSIWLPCAPLGLLPGSIWLFCALLAPGDPGWLDLVAFRVPPPLATAGLRSPTVFEHTALSRADRRIAETPSPPSPPSSCHRTNPTLHKKLEIPRTSPEVFCASRRPLCGLPSPPSMLGLVVALCAARVDFLVFFFSLAGCAAPRAGAAGRPSIEGNEGSPKSPWFCYVRFFSSFF